MTATSPTIKLAFIEPTKQCKIEQRNLIFEIQAQLNHDEFIEWPDDDDFELINKFLTISKPPLFGAGVNFKL